jgi:hypothetical protein
LFQRPGGFASRPLLEVASGDAASDHLRWVDGLVKALFIDIARRESGLLQGQIPVIGLVGDRRSIEIEDDATSRYVNSEVTAL